MRRRYIVINSPQANRVSTHRCLQIMKDIIRKNPGYGDMHVALAADAWSNGDYITALKVYNLLWSRTAIP